SLAGTITLGGEITVNRFGYGAMRITGDGIWGPPKDRAEALRVLKRAVELGVNFIDTADSYGPNVSEELIVEALAPYPKGFVIATKGGWRRPAPGYWGHDASPAHLREALEGSLKRLTPGSNRFVSAPRARSRYVIRVFSSNACRTAAGRED